MGSGRVEKKKKASQKSQNHKYPLGPNKPKSKKTKRIEPKSNSKVVVTQQNNNNNKSSSSSPPTPSQQLNFFLNHYQSANALQLSTLELESFKGMLIFIFFIIFIIFIHLFLLLIEKGMFRKFKSLWINLKWVCRKIISMFVNSPVYEVSWSFIIFLYVFDSFIYFDVFRTIFIKRPHLSRSLLFELSLSIFRLHKLVLEIGALTAVFLKLSITLEPSLELSPCGELGY